MKNKELIKLWEANKSIETARIILNDFFDEIQRLSRLRNLAKSKNTASLVSIIDEVMNKWKKLCDKCPDMRPEGLEEVLTVKMPEVMTAYHVCKSRL